MSADNKNINANIIVEELTSENITIPEKLAEQSPAVTTEISNEVNNEVDNQVKKLLSLSELRVLQNLTSESIASSLRLSNQQVLALEQRKWDVLPAEAYVKGFLRNYCKLLNIDSAPYLKQYAQDIHVVQETSVEHIQVQPIQPIEVKQRNDIAPPQALGSFDGVDEMKLERKQMLQTAGVLVLVTSIFLMYWERDFLIKPIAQSWQQHQAQAAAEQAHIAEDLLKQENARKQQEAQQQEAQLKLEQQSVANNGKSNSENNAIASNNHSSVANTADNVVKPNPSQPNNAPSVNPVLEPAKAARLNDVATSKQSLNPGQTAPSTPVANVSPTQTTAVVKANTAGVPNGQGSTQALNQTVNKSTAVPVPPTNKVAGQNTPPLASQTVSAIPASASPANAKSTPVEVKPAISADINKQPSAPAKDSASRAIDIQFISPVWLELRDKSGAVIMTGMYKANTASKIRAEPPLQLVVGAPQAVKVKVDGQLIDLAGHSTGGVAKIKIQ